MQKTRDLRQFRKIVPDSGFFVCCTVWKHIHGFSGGIVEWTGYIERPRDGR